MTTFYDEALEIIDKNTFELGKGLDCLMPKDRDVILKSLENAKSQEKLLNFYRDFFNQFDVIYQFEILTKATFNYIHVINNEDAVALFEQIKELEK